MPRTPDAAFLERALALNDNYNTATAEQVDKLIADARAFGESSVEMAYSLAVQGRVARWSQRRLAEGAAGLDRAVAIGEAEGVPADVRARWLTTLAVLRDDLNEPAKAIEAAERTHALSAELKTSLSRETLEARACLVHVMRVGLHPIVAELRRIAEIWPRLTEGERKVQVDILKRFANRRSDQPKELLERLGRATFEPDSIQKLLPPPEPDADPAALAAVIAELDGLIGLGEVKAEVKRLAAVLQVEQMRRKAGLPVVARANHFVFLGPPGTGKTTVARLLGRVFKALGILARGHVIEVDRSRLVAGYVGQTAIRVDGAVDTALDGVLFVDEAYALYNVSGNDFGHEAVATLLKRMEDDRGRLVVVLAGYDAPMQRMLSMNPGLRSRFTSMLRFRSYGTDELAAIFVQQARRAGYEVAPRAQIRVREICALMRGAEDPETFGNAREIRNLFEDAVAHQASRLLASGAGVHPLTAQQLSLLDERDIVWKELGDESLAARLSGGDLRTVAYHELGHALVGYLVDGPDPVLVTTIPSGTSLGRTFFSEDARVVATREQMLGRAARVLGGRAAEEVALGTFTSGATHDLEMAERIVLELLRTGMSEETTHEALEEYAVTDVGTRETYRSERTRREVGELLQEAYALAVRLVREREAALHAAAERLMVQRSIAGEELRSLFGPRNR
ncbi:MAG: AAA family ATPase [Planctomycetes bacterium]|nr:AAA family ATPase [Planctomycetota bacterium]